MPKPFLDVLDKPVEKIVRDRQSPGYYEVRRPGRYPDRRSLARRGAPQRPADGRFRRRSFCPNSDISPPRSGRPVVAAAAMAVHLFSPRRGHRWAGYVAFAGIAAVSVVLLLTPQELGRDHGRRPRRGPVRRLPQTRRPDLGPARDRSFRFFDVEGGEPGEIYYLLPLSLVGIMAAVSSADLITTYVAFEVFAIPSYVLAGLFKKERRSGEAGVKYFFLGSLSSALMLLGMGPDLRAHGRRRATPSSPGRSRTSTPTSP